MRSIVCGLVVTGLLATPARAQEPAPKKVTVTAGADVPLLTGYVFRGILQEFNPKFTIQPFIDIGVAASGRATVNVGTWNSFHSGSNKDTYSGAWYESDLYASLTFAAGKWKPGVLYTLYTSPSGGYEGVGDDGSTGVSELAFFASYDDSALPVPFSPKVIVAFETTNTQADFGTKKGVYVEVGVRPTFRASSNSKVTFAVPVKVGLSAKDYFETVDGSAVTDNRFGYLQVGANASVPLSMFKKGSWEAHGGLDVFVFGSNRKALQQGDSGAKSVKPVLNLGVSASF